MGNKWIKPEDDPLKHAFDGDPVEFTLVSFDVYSHPAPKGNYRESNPHAAIRKENAALKQENAELREAVWAVLEHKKKQRELLKSYEDALEEGYEECYKIICELTEKKENPNGQ